MAIQNPQFTTVIGANATKVNTGTVLGAGAVAGTKFTNLTLTTNNLNPAKLQGLQLPNGYNGVGFCMEGSPITITSILQSGAYTLITKTSHGLAVGAKLQINGTNLYNYNIIHTVKGINNANSFQTDCKYTANTSTHGTYSPISGTFNVMAKNKYVASLVCTQLAGLANTALYFMANPDPLAYNDARPEYGQSIVGFDYFSGTVTKGANWGVALNFWNITGNTTRSSETFPTRAIPGFLMFLQGALVPVHKNYNPKAT